MSAVGCLLALSMGMASEPQAAPKEFARVQTLDFESGWRASGGVLADLDGQSPREAVFAVHERGKDFARRLDVWRAMPNAAVRVESVPLTPDVVAFAYGDVLAGGAEELLLFNAGGVFVWKGGGEARPERILECELLWQTADPSDVFDWSEGVRDLDGDGLVDLIVPEPGGFRVALQRRPRAADAPWGIVSHIRVPIEPGDTPLWAGRSEDRRGVAARSSNGRISLGFSATSADDDATDGGTLVSVSESVAAPFWLDWDADRDLDLIVQTGQNLHMWLQSAEGSFAVTPSVSAPLPVARDTARQLDASYSSHAVDFDNDSRADCVIFAGDKRSDDVRTQGLFFAASAVKTGSPLFGENGRPSNLLVFAGFISGPTFRDLDGDGFPELMLRAVRPDLIDQIRSASSESIEADFYVYRNRRGVFSRSPDVIRTRAIPLQRFELSSEFVGDLTGDGLEELLVRDEPKKLRLLMLRAAGARDKSTWSLIEKPLWELDVAEKSQVFVLAAGGREKTALFVVENSQVLWVRF